MSVIIASVNKDLTAQKNLIPTLDTNLRHVSLLLRIEFWDKTVYIFYITVLFVNSNVRQYFISEYNLIII